MRNIGPIVPVKRNRRKYRNITTGYDGNRKGTKGPGYGSEKEENHQSRMDDGRYNPIFKEYDKDHR